MRVVIQRVTQATVSIDNRQHSSIKKGLLIFLGIEDADTDEDIQWLSNKIINLRIFDNDRHIPDVSVKDIDGDILLVSQFTLFASTKKGNRPGYTRASKPETAIPFYEKMIHALETLSGKKIVTGVFGADMQVDLINDGPVTIMIDTRARE